jgi:hypothetical protein
VTATRRVPVSPAHFALVDAADYEAVIAAGPWHLLKGHNGKLYAYGGGSRYMHRLIAQTPTGMETDHVNGDGLDNRRCNLRVATPSQNSANMGKPRRPDGSPPASQFKGVCWDKTRSKWMARITVLGKCRNLGRFDCERDAALAYDRAASAAWGEFALLNFSDASVAA